MKCWRVGLAAIGLLLSGCSTVSTRPVGNAAPGIAYQLPLGKMRLRVTEASGVLSVLLDGPLVVGDPDQRLVAALPQSGVADNNVTVTVDGKTNLLQKVEVISTGRLTDIATNIAKSVVFLQGSDTASGVTVFAGVYDVDALPEAARAANDKLAEYFGTVCQRGASLASLPLGKALADVGQTGDEEKAFLKDRLLRCRAMVLAGADVRDLIRISVAPVREGPAPLVAMPGAHSISPYDLAACRSGICYRPYRSRQVTLDVRGAFSLTDVFLLPDPDALIHVALPAGVFAQQKYTLDFTDGVLTKYQRDGKSELVGLSNLPVAIVTTVLSAPAEALGLRQKGLEAQTAYLGALNNAVAAKNAAAAQCAGKPERCPDTAYKLIGGRLSAPTGGAGGPGPDSNPAPASTNVPISTLSDDVPAGPG